MICSKLTDFYINIPDNSIIQWWRRGVDDGGGSGSGNHRTINNVKTEEPAQKYYCLSYYYIRSRVQVSCARVVPAIVYLTYIYLAHNTQNTTRTVTLSSSPSMTFTIHQATDLSPVFIGKDKTARACPIVIVIVTCASSPCAYQPSVYISGVLEYLIIILLWLFAYACKR